MFASNDYSTPQKAPISSWPKILFESEAKLEAIAVRRNFYSHANKTHFQTKSVTLELVLKMSRKRSITLQVLAE